MENKKLVVEKLSVNKFSLDQVLTQWVLGSQIVSLLGEAVMSENVALFKSIARYSLVLKSVKVQVGTVLCGSQGRI